MRGVATNGSGYSAAMNESRAQDGPWTIARLLSWTQGYFAQRALDAPRLSAEILLGHALGCERIELYTRHTDTPDDATRDRFRALVRRAATGEPIAYLVGGREFFSMPLKVDPRALIPRPDTEVLVERAIALARDSFDGAARILDIGTGSGCIALALAKHLPNATIFASDISDDALALARENAAALKLTDRIEFRTTDLLTGWADAAPLDLIVSNPPYLDADADDVDDSVRDFEPAVALFAADHGTAVLRALACEAPALLAPHGQLMLEIAYNQASAARELLRAAGWADVVTYPDAAGHQRVIHGQRFEHEQHQVA